MHPLEMNRCDTDHQYQERGTETHAIRMCPTSPANLKARSNLCFVLVVTMHFVDLVLTCVDCQKEFGFTADEQYFFQERHFLNTPKRCLPCRARRAKHPLSLRTRTTTTCAECGTPTTVPFVPVRGTPVLCRECFSKGRKRPEASAMHRNPVPGL
jgi:CxxC-x17-CxxC domain-containing protein